MEALMDVLWKMLRRIGFNVTVRQPGAEYDKRPVTTRAKLGQVIRFK